MSNSPKPAANEAKPSRFNRPVPPWFAEAKLGLLFHWGPYSVPAWAPVGERPGPRAGDWSQWFFANPYSEWYRNSLQIPGSPTQQYHAATYGADFPYERFADRFKEAAQRWNPGDWAGLCQMAGARYAVMVAKHHDGFLLWPSARPNPHREDYALQFDAIGELARAVRGLGLRLGLYYSGGLDWTFDPRAIRNVADMVAAIPQSDDYVRYVDGHWRELIDRYRPDIAWNDIGYPAAGDVRQLHAYYYDRVPEGLVNDRFLRYPGGPRLERLLEKPWARRLVSALLSRLIEWGLSSPAAAAWRRRGGEHFDFVTPEYRVWRRPPALLWECARGLGHSFGYNQNEDGATLLSVRELIHLLVDVVGQGGNLLLGVGPAADSTIPELQRERLLGLGRWLAANGEAIYGTRPWSGAAGQTAEGFPVRFTRQANCLYAIVLGTPHDRQVWISSPGPIMGVSLLGYPLSLSWDQGRRGMRITLPEDLPEAPAHVIRIRFLSLPTTTLPPAPKPLPM